MTFSEAIEDLKAGGDVARTGWNGKGMFIRLMEDVEELEPFIVMYTADKKWVPWLASQTDILAEDWMNV